MKLRSISLFVAITFGLSLVEAACKSAPREAPKPQAATTEKLEDVGQLGSLVIRREDYPTVPLLKVPSPEAVAYRRSLYRIKPDRRFLYAIAQVSAILSSRETGPLTLKFSPRGWRVALSGEEVGSLPEIPAYEEMRALLAGWAERQLKRTPAGRLADDARASLAALSPGLTSADSRRTLESLGKLNELWRAAPASQELLQAAARGFAWLAVQSVDELQRADPLMGRALAFVALAEAASPGSTRAEEALLSMALGYESASRRLAEGLPSSRERAYVLEEKEVLGRLAIAAPKDPGTRYLRRLATREDRRPESEAPPEGANLSDLRPWHLGRDFSTTLAIEEALLRSAWNELGLDGAGAPEARLGELEKRLAGKARTLAGPVLDADSFMGFYRGAVYSAIVAKAGHLLDTYGLTEDSEAYARSIDAAPGTAAELKRWLLDLVACRRDTSRVGLLNKDLADLGQVGLFPLERTRYSVASITQFGFYDRRQGMPALFRRLDSRPDGLASAVEAAQFNLADLELEEASLRALFRAAPRTYVRASARLGLLTRDAGLLRGIAAQRDLAPWGRSFALEYLADVDSQSGAEVLAGFRALAEGSRDDHASLHSGIRALDGKLKDPTRALEFVRLCRSLWSGSRDLSWAEAVVQEAKLLRKLGRSAEAYRTAVEAIPSWKHSALEEGVSCLVDLGKLEEALDLARKALERYPDGPEGYATVAEVLWRMDRDDEAASVLAQGLPRYGPYPAEQIGPALTRAFEGKSLERTEAAQKALNRAGVPDDLVGAILLKLADGNDHRKAFQMLKALPGSGPRATQARLAAYAELVKTDGAEAALAWIRSVTQGYDAQLATNLVQWGPHELFLDLFKGRPQAEKQDAYLLLRAATLVYLHRGNDPRREEILKAVYERQKVNPDEWFGKYTRYVLHDADEKVLPRDFLDGSYASSVGWLRGLRSAEAGDYREADAWFQVALDSNQDAYPPNGFAGATIYRWQAANMSLEVLAAKGLL